MTSLNMSSSYNTRFEQSFQTLQLLTHSQECSPIQELYSATSSNMSPQVLFPHCQMNKKLAPQFYLNQRQNQAIQRDSQRAQSRILSLLQGEVHQSFEIEENQSLFQHITQSNLLQRLDINQNKQNIAISPYHCQKSLIKINFTVSRHIDDNLLEEGSRRCPMKQFEQKMQDLRNNVGRLKNIVDRFQNPQKRGRTLDIKKIPVVQSQYLNKLNCQIKKNSESTESGNRVSCLSAKSAQSGNPHSTPQKSSPFISEFQVVKSMSKSDIDQMSPIFSYGEFSELGERNLNTSEISSRMLMKKKFNWKSQRAVNTA